jgi:hypothetical protein
MSRKSIALGVMTAIGVQCGLSRLLASEATYAEECEDSHAGQTSRAAIHRTPASWLSASASRRAAAHSST